MISQELLQGFISEASDLLDDIEPALVSYPRLTDEAERKEIVNRVFRHFHSIKGSAGFVGLHDIARLTHEAETLLEQYQNSPGRGIPHETITLLCRTVDFLRMMFESQSTNPQHDKNADAQSGVAGLEDLINEINLSIKSSQSSVSAKRERHDTTVQIEPVQEKRQTRRRSNTRIVEPDFNALEKQPQPKSQTTRRSATRMRSKTSAGTGARSQTSSGTGSRSKTSTGTERPPLVQHEKSDTVRIIRAGASKESIDKLTKNEFLSRYIAEANELLEQTEQALLLAEQHPEDGNEAIQEALRCLHSFKGNSGFMNLRDLERLSHRMESEIEQTIGRALGLDANTFDALLQMIDVLRQGVLDISCGGTGNIPDVDTYLAMLDEVHATSSTATLRSPGGATRARAAGDASDTAFKMLENSLLTAPQPDDTPATVDLDLSAEPLSPVGAASQQENLAEVKKATTINILDKSPSDTQPDIVEEHRPAATTATETLPRPRSAEQPPPPPPPPSLPERPKDKEREKEREREKKTSSQRISATPRNDIRVDLNKLDLMLDLVGELVIAETMVTRHPAVVDQENESLERAVHQLRRVANSLQDMAMSVRMIPLASTFRRMIRLVYDLSMKAGKLVDLVLLGEETEVDRTVIERISDPLVHIIRNAIDHGIETPEERRALGKPETGRVTIEGRHEGGEVWIVITDDGRGLNRDLILKKATERGLVNGNAHELTDNQVYHYIFEPGFSTADHVTDISGRGFGMDVVKKNIEKLSGRIDIRTREGEGTAVILRIPLTLAIIDGMLVRADDTRYIIPLLSIRESLKPDMEHIMHTPDGQAIIKLREELIPVVRLDEVFSRVKVNKNLEEGILMVVEGEDGGTVALFADELLGQQETVIKGLTGWLKKSRGVSGCTILGDGEVGLILDIGAIVKIAGRAG